MSTSVIETYFKDVKSDMKCKYGYRQNTYNIVMCFVCFNGSFSPRRHLKLYKLALLLSHLWQCFYFKNLTTKLQIYLTSSNTATRDEPLDAHRNKTLLTALQFINKRW